MRPQTFPGSRKSALVAILLFIIVIKPLSGVEAAETIVLSILLNSEHKGEFFVDLTGDGDFFIKVEDLKSMGFRELPGKVIDISGDRYISLKSMPGVEFMFNERDITLVITASPELLPSITVDFTPKRLANVYYPKDNSAFLNYGVNYSKSDPSDVENFGASSQLGIRAGDFLFISDSSYTKSEGNEDLARLMSNITYDRREDMQRVVIGDSFASSGDLGSSINIGGISFSKVYQINPYFIKSPTLDISGLISLPSEVEVYLNGMLIKREKLSPGEFDLKNISYYGGAGLVEIVIIDPFGKRQKISHPFYLTDLLLKKGLHEYSYSTGFMREDFGIDSNRYGDPALSAFHRFGVSDSLTIGLRGEATSGSYSLGPQLSYNSNNAGIFTVSLSNSGNDKEGTGFAASLNHIYYGKSINTKLLLKKFTRDYLVVATDPASEKTKYEAGAGVGYVDGKGFGSLSLDFTNTKTYQGIAKQGVAATYSRNLSDNLSAFVTVKNTDVSNQEMANEFFAGINYYMGGNINLSSSYQMSDDADVEMVQVQKSPPIGEGLGYRISSQRTGPEAASYRLNPSLQYNSRYGIYEGEYRGDYSEDGTGEYYRISASGGIAFIGGAVGFSRPFYDSFGLVKVGDIEGVMVFQNNQEIGRTDPTGKMFIPNMASYYDNQITINDKNIPLNYYISKTSEYVSPPLRSGSCISFDATNIQAIVGDLNIKEDGTVKPVEFHDVRMKADDMDILFPTGRGGEFYFENIMPEEAGDDASNRKGCSYLIGERKLPVIKPGTYKASLDYAGRICSFDMVIPESDEMIINMGEVLCNIAPPSLVQQAIEGPAPLLPEPIPPAPTAPYLATGLPHKREAIVIPPEEKPQTETRDLAPQTFVVYFKFNSSRPASKEDEETIALVASTLMKNPDIKVEIEGHCDQTGGDSYNIKLGTRRALAIEAGFLASGIEKERVSKVLSLGKREPTCPSLNEACRKKNRRAIIRTIIEDRN